LSVCGTKFEVIVISLVTARERREKMSAMLEASALNWSFFDAHSSLQHPQLRYDLRDVKRGFGRTLSPAQIAVGSSHIAVLNGFLERGVSDYILVLEDDIILDPDFPIDRFAAFCAQNAIDYMRLFGKHYAEAVRLGFFFDRSIIRYKTTPTGMQAYLMSQSGARRFIDSFPSINQPIDLGLDSFWITKLPLYSIFPYPVIERYSPTSIPIPPASKELNSAQQLVRLSQRVVNKMEKVAANQMLTAADRRMRQKLGGFQQIT
jgi:glycosyl transferase family 25